MKKSLAVMLALIMVLCMIPTTALATLDTGHKIDVRFTVLYVGDEFNIGYNYGTSEKTQFVCQYSESHSDTAYNNHSIAISDIKAAADRANVNSGYQIVGWSKEANANPTVWSLNKTGTTACNKGTTIYLVAKNPNPQPTKPTANDIPGIVGNNAVKVHCTTNNSHAEKTYGLISGSFTIGDVTKDTTSGNYTCTITVQPGEYVNAYNGTYPKHTLVEPQNHTINLKWNETDKKWVVDSALPVVFDVKCETTQPPTDKPELPKPENTPGIPGLTGAEVVRVECTTTNSSHAANTYPLIADSYDVGNVGGDATSGYTCDITVKPEKYVTQYNLDISGVTHTLVDSNQTGTIKLVWGNQKWNLANPSGVTVVFKVKCDKTVPGSVSAVTKTRLKEVPAGVTLPENVTINKEETVTFTDNNLDATLLYAFTVTGTPGAKVVIKDDRATFIDINGKPVNNEITVTLPNGEGDEAEITVYGYRTFSVDDIQNGKLVNNATANVEGGDNNKKEAKAEVDAKDDRTLKNTLTVKKLVSGNAANPTEKFPFKATFTFPVPVASANLDGVTPVEKVEIIFELANGQTRTFSYTSDSELKTKIDNWMKENTAYWSLTGDAVFAMLSYKVEETNAKGYTLATNGDAEGKADGHKAVTFTNTKNKPNDDHGGHYHPTTTPVPVIVIPPKTGDMTIWQSILHFLGIR